MGMCTSARIRRVGGFNHIFPVNSKGSFFGKAGCLFFKKGTQKSATLKISLPLVLT